MQLNTHSKFYYGWQITKDNRYVDFYDGVSNKTAILDVGFYTTSGLANEIKKKLDALSSVTFGVSFDRNSRKFSFSGDSVFSLLFSSGVYASRSAAGVLGFDYVDKTGLLTYQGEYASGFEYSTQFFIQSFKDTSTNRKAIDGVVNKSASGKIEVIKFGDERFMEGELLFITNIQQEIGSIIRSNTTGLEDYTKFVEWLTEKAPFEFMVDESDLSSYKEFILESSESDPKGLNYDIIEMYDKGLADYYRSGKLTFRLVD